MGCPLSSTTVVPSVTAFIFITSSSFYLLLLLLLLLIFYLQVLFISRPRSGLLSVGGCEIPVRYFVVCPARSLRPFLWVFKGWQHRGVRLFLKQDPWLLQLPSKIPSCFAHHKNIFAVLPALCADFGIPSPA